MKMDPLDEDFLVGLAITGGRTPQSASERDRLIRLEQEGYVEVCADQPMQYVLSARARVLIGAMVKPAPKGE
jgi:hypothetical protein